MTALHEFARHDLGDGCEFFAGDLPTQLVWDAELFNHIWTMHPADKPRIHLHGRRVEIPRWQQAYGRDYHFSGQNSPALPIPEVLQPLHEWARSEIDERLNGLLLNWYDGPGHYIGPHRDSRKNMIPGAPIVTVSFGETRVFRLSRVLDNQKRIVDFPASNGSIFVMPYATNLVWKHGVPKSTRYVGRRISVTVRAFE